MKSLWTIICLASFMTCEAQSIATDLSLQVTSNEFEDGILPGESGFIDFHVTNNGPLLITDEDYWISVTHGHNVTQDLNLYYQFQFADPIGEGCVFYYNNGDPRPPEDNFRFWQSHTYIGPLDVNESITCRIPVTFPETGYLEMLWRVGPRINDPDLSNNEVPFVLRGQALPVPLNIIFALILILMISASLKLRFRNVNTQ